MKHTRKRSLRSSDSILSTELARLNKTFRSLPPCLEPAYVFDAGGNIVLHEGAVKLRGDKGKAVGGGRGSLYIQWRPDPRLRADLELQSMTREWPNLDRPATVDLICGGKKLPGFIPTVIQPGRSTTRVVGSCNGAFSPTTRSMLRRCRFHLVNGPQYIGSPLRSAKKAAATYAGRVVLAAQGWEVTVDMLPEYQKMRPEERTERRYALSHVGEFGRSGDAGFSAKEAEEQLEALRFFFSLCGARRIGPFLPVGYDDKGRRAWYLWAGAALDPYAGRISWHRSTEPEVVQVLFPGFMKRWRGQSSALRVAVAWYREAHNDNATVDSRIVLAQAGLERLCYEVLVNDRKVLSHEGISKLPMKEQLTVMFSLMGVNVKIPPAMRAIIRECKPRQWDSFAAALTATRNGLVHGEIPRKAGGAKKKIPADVLREVWVLSVRSLALALLYYCDYRGKWTDPAVSSAQSCTVPWA